MRIRGFLNDMRYINSRFTYLLTYFSLYIETQAPGQPTAVRTMTSSDSAVVSWLPPDDNTLVRTYMIGYGEGVPDVKWIYVNGSQSNVTIHHLSMQAASLSVSHTNICQRCFNLTTKKNKKMIQKTYHFSVIWLQVKPRKASCR